MNKYEKGKIYKIESMIGNKIYIGSTTNDYLSNRMAKHRNKYKSYKLGKEDKYYVFDIFDEYGIENCFITLIENCKCNDINELRDRERFYIKSLDCVNKNIPTRTLKEYYIDNKEHIKEASKKTYELNKNELFECKCGSVVKKLGKYRHLKKHCKLIFNEDE